MTINRRSFFASLAAVVVAPAVPVTRPDPVREEIARVSRKLDALQAFLEQRRPMLNLDQLSQYRNQVENTVRQNTKAR